MAVLLYLEIEKNVPPEREQTEWCSTFREHCPLLLPYKEWFLWHLDYVVNSIFDPPHSKSLNNTHPHNTETIIDQSYSDTSRLIYRSIFSSITSRNASPKMKRSRMYLQSLSSSPSTSPTKRSRTDLQTLPSSPSTSTSNFYSSPILYICPETEQQCRSLHRIWAVRQSRILPRESTPLIESIHRRNDHGGMQVLPLYIGRVHHLYRG